MRTVISLALLVSLMGMPLYAVASAGEAGPNASVGAAVHETTEVQGEEEHGAHHHGLPPAAPDLFHIGPLPVSNSQLVTWVVAAGLILMAQVATRRMQAVPFGVQNFVEWVVEGLYGFLEGIIGPELVRKTFWFFATLFIFILSTNYFGLLPGVGSLQVNTEHGMQPLFRGANADMNMTFGMAMIFFFLWTVWAIQANGVKGFVLHIFGPKGETTGLLKFLMILVFMVVGILEMISILFRPVSLSFRLYGNIFAGENMLETMHMLIQDPPWAKFVASVLIPIPFYFLELLVGMVQALVFMLLTAVFTLLICMHDEDQERAHH